MVRTCPECLIIENAEDRSIYLDIIGKSGSGESASCVDEESTLTSVVAL